MRRSRRRERGGPLRANGEAGGGRAEGSALTSREAKALAVLAALLAFVLVVDLLWGHAIYPEDLQDRFAWQTSPFPRFPTNDTLHVVPVPRTANASTLLTLASLQGLVNREGARLYLDRRDELGDEGSILRYLSRAYGTALVRISLEEALARYLSVAEGLFVVDPDRPESVNVGTMLASLHGWALATPKNANLLSREWGVPLRMAYAQSSWAALSPAEVYRRALEEVYPRLESPFIAILPPERPALRDYLVASGAFVFHFPQGALASPLAHAATLEILHATPRGLPILGWFDSPTVTEENLFVQMSSREGKTLVGGYDVPNLSVLASYGRDRTFSPPSTPPAPPALENKTYAAVALADGDSLDYLTIRMWDLWKSSVRGTFPVAWSLNPLLVDLAPAYLDYYYETATSGDFFLASPSGAGYLYPDYLREGDLGPYLEVSRRYMEAAGLDIVWLLNAFPASEVSYSEESLSAYVDVVRPRGIVLDYDDAPVARATWIQAGGGAASPVVRSTHLWTTEANFLAKVQSALDASGPGPRFLWITVYPWRFTLENAQEVVQVLEQRVGGELKVVPPNDFFTLLQRDVIRRAADELQRARRNPLIAPLFAPLLDDAEGHLDQAQALAASGEEGLGAYHAFLAGETLAHVSLVALVAVVSATTGGSLLAVWTWRRRSAGTAKGKPPPREVMSLIVSASVMATFLVAVRSALEANFWAYHFLIVAAVGSASAVPVAGLVRRVVGPRASLLASALLPPTVALTVYTAVALPLVTLVSVWVMCGRLQGDPRAGPKLYASLLLGGSLGLLVPVTYAVVALLGVPLVAAALLSARNDVSSSLPRPTRGSWYVGVVMTLPLFALAVAHSSSLSLRVGMEGEALIVVGVAALAGGALLSLAVPLGGRGASHWTLLLMGGAGALLLVSHHPVLTVLLLLGMAAGAALYARATLDRFVGRGGEPTHALRAMLVTAPLLLLFLRLPPLAYSLLLLPLPEVLEYGLYARQAVAAGVALLLFGGMALRRLGRKGTRTKAM